MGYSALREIYNRLYRRFGPQRWWPGETAFEVIVGAILTQNTAWTNVEKAIANLKREKVLFPQKLHGLNSNRLARLIKPSGFYNLKAQRLKHFMNFLFGEYDGSLKRMFAEDTSKLRAPLQNCANFVTGREKLLSVKGVGPETADSILLYAAGKPVFVVDAYTRRVLSRHKLIRGDESYDEIQRLFMSNLKPDVSLYNEYHALLVKVGKTFCRRSKPLCGECPLTPLPNGERVRVRGQ